MFNVGDKVRYLGTGWTDRARFDYLIVAEVGPQVRGRAPLYVDPGECTVRAAIRYKAGYESSANFIWRERDLELVEDSRPQESVDVFSVLKTLPTGGESS